LKFFKSNSEEKITEKAFTQSLVISVVSILLCIVALCSITFAWFTGSTTSNSNTLSTGNFDLNASVIYNGEKINTVKLDDKITCTLADAGTYEITLSMTDDSTVKGFCLVSYNSSGAQTESIIKEGDDVTNPFTFKITTTEANTVVTFESKWGSPANPEIYKDGTHVIQAVSSQETSN